MCDPVTIMVSAGVSAAGSIYKGNAEKKAAYAEAALLERQGAIDMDNALAAAEGIRRDGRTARGQTVAAIGASGVLIGQGSTLDAERQVMQDAETDAAMAVLNGQRGQQLANEQASGRRKAGRAAKVAGFLDAGSTLLSGAVSAGRAAGWRAYGPGFSGGQAPAPVVDRSWRG